MPGTNNEPVAVIGGISLTGITALAAAALILLDVFNVYDVTDEQTAAVIGVIAAMWAVFVPALLSIRGIVSSPETVAQTKIDLATSPQMDKPTATALAK